MQIFEGTNQIQHLVIARGLASSSRLAQPNTSRQPLTTS